MWSDDRLISVIRASLESLVHENDAGKQQRPVPEFHYKAVSCILRADRYGMARDFCSLPRSRVEARRKKTMEILRRVTVGSANVRLVDPIDLFCDRATCRPTVGRSLLYKGTNHLSRFGADWFFGALKQDFLWAFTGTDLAVGDRLGAGARSGP